MRDTGTSGMTAGRPRLLIADDHRMMADAIHAFLRDRFEVVDVVFDGNALLEAVTTHAPGLVLADISMPGLSGIEVLRRVRQSGIRPAFVFMSVHAEPALVRAAMASGAHGYILKGESGSELLHALDEVMQGRVCVSAPLVPHVRGNTPVPRLTPKQAHVLALIAEGKRSREIASTLAISVRTVETHRYAIMKLFGASSSIGLVNQAIRLGLLHAGDQAAASGGPEWAAEG